MEIFHTLQTHTYYFSDLKQKIKINEEDNNKRSWEAFISYSLSLSQIHNKRHKKSYHLYQMTRHTSQFHGLCLKKSPTEVDLSVFHFMLHWFIFSPNELKKIWQFCALLRYGWAKTLKFLRSDSLVTYTCYTYLLLFIFRKL